jgi:hypothetical protein
MKKGAFLSMLFVAYLMLLVGINFLHFRYLIVDVIFYATLADALLAAGILAAALTMARVFASKDTYVGSMVRQLSGTEMMLFGFCAILSGYIFAISVPTVIDRSLSIYILEKLDQRGGAISLKAMNEIFVQEFIPEHRLMDARMTEQLTSGTVTIENGCVTLTPRGRRIATLTRFYRTNLLPKNRVLMGEVSDDLTDPFRHSVPVVDYRCPGRQSPAKDGRE